MRKQNFIPVIPHFGQEQPGSCPKCGMTLVPTEKKPPKEMDHGTRKDHTMKLATEMNFLEKLKMSMMMTMGMEHTGLAGREMARLMELDIRNKFFFAFFLSVPIIAYSPLGEKILGLQLPSPIPAAWILFVLTTPVFFYSGWIFLYSTYKALQQKMLNMAVLIAVGITAAYAFSVVLPFLGDSDSYYEAESICCRNTNSNK